MTDEIPQICMIPVHDITILNPRARNKRIFNELAMSIAHLGLKKPITVTRHEGKPGYDLVCGQGRLEAFISLGQTEIPAVVVDATEEECFIMSLVENLARRHHSSLELMREIGALKERGYSINEIASKIDFSGEYVAAICYLLEHGEERLLRAIERGVIPHSIAMEIARAKDGEVQAALADAYEKQALPGNQVLAIRRIVEQRNSRGKSTGSSSDSIQRHRSQVTASTLIRAYQKEAGRQKLLVKKAALTQSRLVFVVNALRSLLADDHFVTLLRAEAMHTMPRPLAERMHAAKAP